jgi:hypothetical protein
MQAAIYTTIPASLLMSPSAGMTVSASGAGAESRF